jgi:hypothetical protein
MAELMLTRGWVARARDDRSARVTPGGLRALQEEFGLLADESGFRAPVRRRSR